MEKLKITPALVLESYKKTGLKPCTETFGVFNGYTCPVGAVVRAHGLEEVSSMGVEGGFADVVELLGDFSWVMFDCGRGEVYEMLEKEYGDIPSIREISYNPDGEE